MELNIILQPTTTGYEIVNKNFMLDIYVIININLKPHAKMYER